MSLDANKKIATDLIESFAGAAVRADLLADDVKWWTAGMGDMSKEKFLGGIGYLASAASEPGSMTVHSVIAEGDEVAVEAESRFPLKNGKTYNNRYHLRLRVKDGRVIEGKEYNDTAHAREVFAG